MKRLLALAMLAALAIVHACAYEIISRNLADSRIYPSTTHKYKISVPDGYNGSEACLYVGLDGILCDAPARIDSLIATGDIPPMIGVYLEPGYVADADGTVIRYNRSSEFDATDGRFARFIETELLPDVRSAVTAAGIPVRIKEGGEHAMIFGLSSGGIASFVASWLRPDLFSRIFSGCGTFVPMRGGNDLQALVRKAEPGPCACSCRTATATRGIRSSAPGMKPTSCSRPPCSSRATTAVSTGARACTASRPAPPSSPKS